MKRMISGGSWSIIEEDWGGGDATPSTELILRLDDYGFQIDISVGNSEQVRDLMKRVRQARLDLETAAKNGAK